MPQAATITTELPIRLSHKFHMIVTGASPQLMEVHILEHPLPRQILIILSWSYKDTATAHKQQVVTTELAIRLLHKFHMIVTVASPQLMEVHILYSILRLALDGIWCATRPPFSPAQTSY